MAYVKIIYADYNPFKERVKLFILISQFTSTA